MPAKIKISDLDNLLRRYVTGESENKLSREIGVNRWTFRQRLLEAGIAPRNQSESETLKWASMTIEQRAAQVAPAHLVSKNREVFESELEQRAITRQLRGSKIVVVETLLADWLRGAGLPITQQRAVGRYNLDIAVNIPPIAVEIFGGNWHTSGRHKIRFFKRTPYLLNAGWHVLIIWIDSRHYPLTIECAKYIIEWANQLRCNPTAYSQYRVILGNGQPAPIRESKFNTPAIIKRFCNGY